MSNEGQPYCIFASGDLDLAANREHSGHWSNHRPKLAIKVMWCRAELTFAIIHLYPTEELIL